MKRRDFVRLSGILVMAIVVTSFSAPTLKAQEASAENLISMSTSIKTAGPIGFSDTPTEALTPTTVTCPGGCTLRIELSSQFSNVPIGSVAAVYVVVDDSPIDIYPTATIGFDSTSNSGASNVRTFAWMKKDLAHGKHTIRVFLFLAGTSGSAGSFSRTLTVGVYKP